MAPPLEDVEPKVSGKSSALRNELMIALARQITVGYMTPQRKQHNATQMGWTIYEKLKTGTLSSLEMRQLLNQYLHLSIF